MLKPLNLVLTKAAIEATQQYSQRMIKMQGQQTFVSRAVSTKTINMRKKQEEYIVKEPTKEQKVAALILRNIIRQYLRKPFKCMLSRLVIKKTAYKLLTNKKKRDLEAAFLSIKNYKIKSQHSHMTTFFLRHTQLRIFGSLIRKKERQNLELGFNGIKNLSIRTNKINIFLNMLDQSTNRCIKRIYYSQFFTKMRLMDVEHYEKVLTASDIVKIDRFRLYNLKQLAFHKITDTILVGQCQNTSQIKKNKHEAFTSMSANKKQQLAQIREQLKALKASIDQEKLNKNKVFQERKKVNNTNKTTMAEASRKFDKQLKEQQAITKDIEDIYKIRERVMSLRDRLKQSSQGSQDFCLSLITIMNQYGETIKHLSQILPQIDSQLSKFRQSQIYLLKTNSLLQKLIEIYERREPYNYQSEYYELQYENNVIKEMIRCFIKQQQYALIHLSRASETQSESD